MFHKLVKCSFALSAAAVLCLAGPATAGPTIPAKGSGDGQVTLQINPTPTNPVGRQEFIATGVGTLIGRHTNRGVTFFTADGCVLPSSFFVVTAADGSTCSGSYSGTFAPIPGTPNFRFDVVVLVQRGTGRLAGLTGRLNVTALLNGQTGALHYDFNGVWVLP